MTVAAPRALAIWTANEPTPPAAAWMSTVSSLATPSFVSTVAAVCPDAESAPAAVHGTEGGLGTTCPAGTTTCSACAARKVQPATLSPVSTVVTPSPTSSTTPAKSPPIFCGKTAEICSRTRPLRIRLSNGSMPLARTRTRTCPGAGRGGGILTTWRTSGSPYSTKTTALLMTDSFGYGPGFGRGGQDWPGLVRRASKRRQSSSQAASLKTVACLEGQRRGSARGPSPAARVDQGPSALRVLPDGSHAQDGASWMADASAC